MLLQRSGDPLSWYVFLLMMLCITSPLFAQKLDYAESSDQETIVTQVKKVDANTSESNEQNTSNAEDAEVVSPLVNLNITGQIRHRTEMHERFDMGGEDIPRFHLLRTRLNVSFQPVQDIIALVQIQDSRLFGGQDPTLARGTLDGSADALDFHQAYFQVSSLFNTSLGVKVGRQELAYGNERLIGAAGWHNVGRTFDAAVVRFKDKHRTIDVFTSQLVGTTNVPTSQNLHGFYGTFHYLWTHNADVFFLADNNKVEITGGPDTGENRLDRYTFGGSLFGKEGAFDYRVEFANQRGSTIHTDSTARSSIDAYLMSGEAGFVFYRPAGVKATLVYTRLSGDDSPGDREVRSFNTLFGTNHKFYGFLDYYPASYSAYGLQNMVLKLTGNAGKRLKWKVDLHSFRLVEEAPLGEETASSLGREVDLTFVFKYNTNFSIGTGASVYMADPLMENIIGDSSSWGFYLTTAVNF